MAPKPQALIQWEEWAAMGRPRCCHTCESFSDGWCSYYNMEPPAEFVALIDSCPAHKEAPPF